MAESPHPLAPTTEHLALAGQSIQDGHLVVMPTETVYGLGADALNASAVARVFAVKARPSFDPLIVHVAGLAAAQDLAAAWPKSAQALAEAFWPGPLTLVLPKKDRVPDLVTSGLPSVGIRWPAHPVAQALIQASGRPIAAPSANRFGSISPTLAEHAALELGPHLGEHDRILNGGPCATGVESTVISLVNEPTLLRPGGVPVEAIEAVLGHALRLPTHAEPSKADASDQTGAQQGLASPGMLERHYAPSTPMTLFAQGQLQGQALPAGTAKLSLPTDPTAAAAALFTELRRLDNDPSVAAIYAERVAEAGLGRAINDRLTRAASKRSGSATSEEKHTN